MQSQVSSRRRIRVCYFNSWAGPLQVAAEYVARVPAIDLSRFVTNPKDNALLAKARLDCDWYAENARCFSSLEHPGVEFLPAWVCGKDGLIDLPRAPREAGEERWLITMGQQPNMLGAAAGKAFELLSKLGVRHFFYAFDEASRFMPCFTDIAPYLSVLVHDEAPLDPRGEAALKSTCRRRHRSWVANVIPFAAPFNETPEKKILFLGSQLGLTPHRRRQIEFLQSRFKDRFMASCDHSIAVGDRLALNRYQVGLCPEGRKFTTPPMSKTHTDRPFWSGCLGMVPVSENSAQGGRLEELAKGGLIVRYEHGDLKSLAAACEQALEVSMGERRRIYEHFNREETVGRVVADAIVEVAS